jgi:hypothetical protein
MNNHFLQLERQGLRSSCGFQAVPVSELRVCGRRASDSAGRNVNNLGFV